MLLEFSEDVLQKLQNSLEEIRKTADKNINSSDSDISDSLDNINGAVTKIKDNLELLSDDVEGYADDVADNINDISGRIHTALDRSEYVTNGISDGADKFSEGFAHLEESGDYLKKVTDSLGDASDILGEANDNFFDASSYLERASRRFRDSMDEFETAAGDLDDGLRDLKKALKKVSDATNKKSGIEASFNDTYNSLYDIQGSWSRMGEALVETADTLDELQQKGYMSGLESVVESLRALGERLKNIADAMQNLVDACLILADDFDLYTIESGFALLESGFNNLSLAFDSIKKASDNLGESLDVVEASSKDASSAIDKAKEGIECIKDGTDLLSGAANELGDIVDEMTEGGAVKFPSVSEMLDGDMDRFFDSIEDMQSEFSGLNDVLSKKKDNATADLKRVSGEMKAISDMLSDAYDSRVKTGEKEHIEDISDEDSALDIRGKIELSQNFGKVLGDVNTGGIVGSMAIEYDFDPEDDAIHKGDRTLDFTYKTKCVVRRCKNMQEITSKKHYGGGIVGRMDLGSVIFCENYGSAVSEDGDYVGGIAGKSEAVIRNCAAKCYLSGGDYIGGIVGEGKDISECYSVPSIDGYGEMAGSVAGIADRDGIKNNFFVSDELGGIDDINYAGAAESGGIDGFVNFVRASFGHDVEFALTFEADEKEIARVNFIYKTPIPEEDIPAVPKKDGYYGKWSEYDFNSPTYDATITAEYSRNMDIIASDLKRANGQSVIIVCGAFDDEAKVLAASSGGTVGGRKKVDSCSVLVDGGYASAYTVRYLPLSKNGNCDIYVRCNGKSQKVKTKHFGSYLEFEAPGGRFEVIEVKKSYMPLLIVVGILLAAAAAVALRKQRK